MRAAIVLGLCGICSVTAAAQVADGNGPAAGTRHEVARPEPAQKPVEIRTSVSRTAVWVGDRVTYTVDLRCAPNVDVLSDDLLKERLRIEGGEIVSAESERDESRGRITHRVRYTLVTYRVDVSSIRIDALPVRYYARGRGQRPGDAAPAGEVMIPPLRVAVRSTIPESDEAIALRPPADPREAPMRQRLARPIGVALVLIAIVPAAVLSLGVSRRLRALRTAYDSRRRRQRRHGSFEDIKALQPASDIERIDAYGKLDAFVRDHLAATTRIAAHSLTPAGLARALEGRTPPLPHQNIQALLAACERARYAPYPPSAAEWEATLRQAQEVMRSTAP